MESEWRLFPLLGILAFCAVIYLSFNDDLSFPVLWQPTMGFVATNSTYFIITDGHDGRGDQSPLYINGWNSYWLMEKSVWGPSRSTVSKMLKMGSQMGLTVCRTWAFSDGDGPNALQVSPGVFNERVFRVCNFLSRSFFFSEKFGLVFSDNVWKMECRGWIM